MRVLFRSVALGLAAMPATIAFAQQLQTEVRVTVGNVEDRTTTIVARMTPVQREHARLHQSRQPTGRWTTKLLDQLLSVEPVIDYGWIDAKKVRSPRAVLTTLACRSDAVFIARVAAFEGLPTEDGMFLFTDYTLRPSEVIRTSRRVKALTPGQTVIATRPGGVVTIERVNVSMSLPYYPALAIDRDYLLIANVLPATEAFDLHDLYSVLELRDGFARALASGGPSVDYSLFEPGAVLSRVKDWVAGCR